mmetsp:Transcript_14764/g.60260  ORF Transcript_14764/g.60260 Transcript_14764/m.60260 type:complete len:286 (+) Transcript_14764:694-1551(+)
MGLFTRSFSADDLGVIADVTRPSKDEPSCSCVACVCAAFLELSFAALAIADGRCSSPENRTVDPNPNPCAFVPPAREFPVGAPSPPLIADGGAVVGLLGSDAGLNTVPSPPSPPSPPPPPRPPTPAADTLRPEDTFFFRLAPNAPGSGFFGGSSPSSAYAIAATPASCAGCSTLSPAGMAYTASTAVSGDSAHAMRIRRLSCESDMFSRPRVGSRMRFLAPTEDSAIPSALPSPTRATDNSNDCDHSALGAASDAALTRRIARDSPLLSPAGAPPQSGTGSFAVR